MQKATAKSSIGWWGYTLWFAMSMALAADPPTWDEASALRFSQSVLGQPLGEHLLTDHRGQPITLKAAGRPLVVSLIYTSCYHICPTITRNLAIAVAVARQALGAQAFDVVSVGFDSAQDTPARLREFAAARGIDTASWRFLRGDTAAIERLARSLGFIFFASPKGFDHLTQVSVIGADGRVYRQLYGDDLSPPGLVEPLKELVFGQTTSAPSLRNWLRGIKLWCTVYDARSGRYQFDYSIFMVIIAASLTLGGTAWYIVHAWRAAGRHDAGVRP